MQTARGDPGGMPDCVVLPGQGQCAPFMAYWQPAVQAFKYLQGCPGIAGVSGPGSNCRVCSWNLTVLSLPTLRLFLKHRNCSRHNSVSRGRKADYGCCGGTPKRKLNQGRKCSNGFEIVS